MMYIVGSSFEHKWHVGENIPRVNVLNVNEVMADGHELEYIQNIFPTLPIPKKRVVRFIGDVARNIVANL